jgi:hypothetical protein
MNLSSECGDKVTSSAKPPSLCPAPLLTFQPTRDSRQRSVLIQIAICEGPPLYPAGIGNRRSSREEPKVCWLAAGGEWTRVLVHPQTISKTRSTSVPGATRKRLTSERWLNPAATPGAVRSRFDQQGSRETDPASYRIGRRALPLQARGPDPDGRRRTAVLDHIRCRAGWFGRRVRRPARPRC